MKNTTGANHLKFPTCEQEASRLCGQTFFLSLRESILLLPVSAVVTYGKLQDRVKNAKGKSCRIHGVSKHFKKLLETCS